MPRNLGADLTEDVRDGPPPPLDGFAMLPVWVESGYDGGRFAGWVPSVPGVLAVADSSDEASYVPALEAAGYVLRIREPDWYEHRLFKGPDTNINLHVFSQGCEEIDVMLAFRDHLRTDEADRELYERTKRELAARDWEYVQDYADAKTEVVKQIVARAG